MAADPSLANGFSERDFYLAEFRGRTLAFALESASSEELSLLEAVVRQLEANRTGTLLLSRDRRLLESAASGRVVDSADPRWIGRLWRTLQSGRRVAVALPADDSLAAACRRIALRLRLAKVIWIDPEGSLRSPTGERISFVDRSGLERLLAGPEPGDASRRELLSEIGVMVSGGVPAVNLCSLAGLDDDLFTFEGSGTFFARERYLDVRRLALDEFDAAERLVQRGVEEGYLAPRGPEQLETVLANAFGVFVEGRYLAGIGALLPWGAGSCGEIGSLYTLTRFLGEGVGGHLVRFALAAAAEQGLPYVFACTTSSRVQAFFERLGFRAVGQDEIPKEKWQGYPEERRSQVRCLRCDLGA
jgi:N-acetylglutamate synthase-like GNAT family acetyltransferase